MAMMKYREPNEVKWFGVRPAHRGEQVAKTAQALNATVVVHTVTAGKTLFLVQANLVPLAHTSSYSRMYIRDGADALWFYLCGANNQAGLTWACPSFEPMIPLEVPAGYDLVVVSGAATVTVQGSIFGWEE
jgi:hypothetical protein